MLNEVGLKAAVRAAQETVFGKGVPVCEEDFIPIRAAITAYLATVQGEPVAWRYKYNGQWYLSQSMSFAMQGFDLEPLYTHPVADSAGREPITHRNEAAGYTETVNEDGPTITRKADEVLLSAEGPRRVVGCRVYDQKGVEAAWPIGTPVSIEHDGFIGRVIGYYRREDGKQGVVLQQDGTLVVHVYGEKWLTPASTKGGE